MCRGSCRLHPGNETFKIQLVQSVRILVNEHREVDIEIRFIRNDLAEEKPMGNHRNIPLDVHEDENNEDEDYEDENQEDDCGDTDQHENINAVPRKGPGKPRKVLTGLRGRPRKEYQEPHDHARYTESEIVNVSEVPLKQAISGILLIVHIIKKSSEVVPFYETNSNRTGP